MSASTIYARLYALPYEIRCGIEARYDGPIPEEAVAHGEALAAARHLEARYAAQAVGGAKWGLGGKAPRRQLSLRISDDAWRGLQMLRLETGQPVNKLLSDAIDEYLAAKASPNDL